MPNLLALACLLASSAAPAAGLPRPAAHEWVYAHAIPAANTSRGHGRDRFLYIAYRTAWELPRTRAAPPLELLLEPKFGAFYRPEARPLGGLGAALRARGPAGLFLEAGAGLLWTDFELLQSHFNFELFAGPALELRLGRRWRLVAG